MPFFTPPLFDVVSGGHDSAGTSAVSGANAPGGADAGAVTADWKDSTRAALQILEGWGDEFKARVANATSNNDEAEGDNDVYLSSHLFGTKGSER